MLFRSTDLCTNCWKHKAVISNITYQSFDEDFTFHPVCVDCFDIDEFNESTSRFIRHITLDRSMYGSDQAASIEVGSLERFVETVRMVPLIKGDGIKKITDNEKIVKKKL